MSLTRHVGLHRFKTSRATGAVLSFALFAVVGGSILLLQTRAAGVVPTQEAEQGSIGGNAAVISDATASGGQAVKFGTSGTGGYTAWHYAPNGTFDANHAFLPGPYGFNLVNVDSAADLPYVPVGDKAFAWVGLCNGADSNFIAALTPYENQPNIFGFYLMDEPDQTGQWAPLCPIANLKAESDWIHAHIPGTKTFIISLDMAASSNPSYAGTYTPANSDIDLYGLDPYPCRTELSGCDYTYITKAVAAAEAAGIPLADIVPVYQTFGLGGWVDDGGSTYAVPTAAQEQQILSTWASAVPAPAFDYAYSWGTQNGDTALQGLPSLQQVFVQHNQ